MYLQPYIHNASGRLKTPKASHRILLPHPTPIHYCSTTTVGHVFKRENGTCPGLWTWILLILERTTPRHIFWFQLQCICHQVHRFLSLPPSAVYDDTKIPNCVQHSLRSAMWSELPTATFLFLPNWENKSINAPCACSESTVLRWLRVCQRLRF